MDIRVLCHEAWKTAETKGFHEDTLNVGERLMLIVSELGEAMEAHRTPYRADPSNLIKAYEVGNSEFMTFFEENIKDSFEDELADVFIRLGDLIKTMGININSHIYLKMMYNDLRPYRHGKEY